LDATATEGVKLGNSEPERKEAPAFGPIPIGVLCTYEPARSRNESVVTKSRLPSPRVTFFGGRSPANTNLLTHPVG
jgi:hypothetical protein